MKPLVPALAVLVLAACSAARPPGTPAATPAAAPAANPAAGPRRVDGATARQLVQAGARLVDVRTREEFEAGHVAGALLVPYEQVGARVAEIGPPGEPVVVYCRSGRRSAIAAETLRKLGFSQVYDLGPMDAWSVPVASASR